MTKLLLLPYALFVNILGFAVPGYEEHADPDKRSDAIEKLKELKLVAKSWVLPMSSIVEQFEQSVLTLMLSLNPRELNMAYQRAAERGKRVTELYICTQGMETTAYKHTVSQYRHQKRNEVDWVRIFANLSEIRVLNLDDMPLETRHVLPAIEAASDHCPKLRSLTLPDADNEDKMNEVYIEATLKKLYEALYRWRVKGNIGGLRRLTVPSRGSNQPFRVSKEFFDNVIAHCPQVEILDGYMEKMVTSNFLLCDDAWLLTVCDWERFNATCTKLRHFNWIVVPFGDPYFRIFGEYVKPQLKRLCLGISMSWKWQWYFHDSSEAAGIILDSSWEQQDYCERPGYGFRASDVSAALKGCPNLDELRIQLYHPRDLDMDTDMNTRHNISFTLFPEHEVVNIDVFDDNFCEVLASNCPYLSTFVIEEVAELYNWSNLKPIKTLTDQGLLALSRLKFLQKLELRSSVCSGKGVFEFLNNLSTEFTGNRLIRICIGSSESRKEFYTEVLNVLNWLTNASDLPCTRQKFVLVIENWGYYSRDPVTKKWSQAYFRKLQKSMDMLNMVHPSLRQHVVTMGGSHDDSVECFFRRIAEFGLYSMNADSAIYSEREGWEDECYNDGISISNRISVDDDSDSSSSCSNYSDDFHRPHGSWW